MTKGPQWSPVVRHKHSHQYWWKSILLACSAVSNATERANHASWADSPSITSTYHGIKRTDSVPCSESHWDWWKLMETSLWSTDNWSEFLFKGEDEGSLRLTVCELFPSCPNVRCYSQPPTNHRFLVAVGIAGPSTGSMVFLSCNVKRYLSPMELHPDNTNRTAREWNPPDKDCSTCL